MCNGPDKGDEEEGLQAEERTGMDTRDDTGNRTGLHAFRSKNLLAHARGSMADVPLAA